MTYTFLQLPKAQNEIIDAWEWYEDKKAGLGDDFKREVASKIGLIIKNPLHYPLKGRYREARVEVFPFTIVYKIDENKHIVIIVSVFHTSRLPENKSKRK